MVTTMAQNNLFGNRIVPACMHCELSNPAGREEFRTCIKKGVVPADFRCRHYRYDPTLRVPRRPLELEAFKAEDFAL